jgi:predicted transposase YbfD/YdcC
LPKPRSSTGDQTFDVHETVDGDHGCIEIRRHRVSTDVGWLATNRRFPGEPRFPALAALAMVESRTERDGRVSTARHYYLTSAPLAAATFARAVRAHWAVENNLHWIMDVVFHDDLMRLRTGHGPANMAVIRHAAINIIKAIPGKQSLKVKRNSPGMTTRSLWPS